MKKAKITITEDRRITVELVVVMAIMVNLKMMPMNPMMMNTTMMMMMMKVVQTKTMSPPKKMNHRQIKQKKNNLQFVLLV